MNVYTAGDAISMRATLRLNGAPDDVTGLLVQAALASPDGSLVPGSLVAAVVENGPSGQVRADFAPASTAGLAAGIYRVEFKATFITGPVHYEPVAITLRTPVAP